MTKPPEDTLRVEVRGKDLPGLRFDDPQDAARPGKEPVYLGLQRGREVTEPVPADRKSVTFMAEFRVATRPDGAPNFLGPYAQGTVADRFFYLCWGVRVPSGGFHMFRRLKIRLDHLGWPEIRRALAAGQPIRVDLKLTDARGGPLCATPPPTHIHWTLP